MSTRLQNSASAVRESVPGVGQEVPHKGEDHHCPQDAGPAVPAAARVPRAVRQMSTASKCDGVASAICERFRTCEWPLSIILHRDQHR